ncbi:ribosomal-processing cysteine protease Prp [Saccharibacillus alkalitolerans]|uniref:Ribosomal processing cysteine protease Prp n=1 Tax=Saccharibacillus alkalitolerans TaxID=2705290 RepID=A0ABX0FC31_9BACL|nr:ribosomal-processing cysteine protease Prp [Saccharibacillus alkalitolerans]NGZ77514.1 ribosomal-processing cysteine protease Prp [Saccharibacillus alkalitolerans]
MVIVQIVRSPDGKITGFKVQGHAGYANRGEDIVCSAISAITVGTVNSVEVLTGTVMKTRMKNGFLSGTLPPIESDELKAQAELILESMVVMLGTIETSYREYIRVDQVTK